MGKPINEEVVTEHWNDALRLTASIKTVSVKPSAMLRKLGAYRQQNRLYLALGEIARIERTLFMLDWMESPQLRMECQAGLNKGEARHALALAVVGSGTGAVAHQDAGFCPRLANPSGPARTSTHAPACLNLCLASRLFYGRIGKGTDKIRVEIHAKGSA